MLLMIFAVFVFVNSMNTRDLVFSCLIVFICLMNLIEKYFITFGYHIKLSITVICSKILVTLIFCLYSYLAIENNSLTLPITLEGLGYSYLSYKETEILDNTTIFASIRDYTESTYTKKDQIINYLFNENVKTVDYSIFKSDYLVLIDLYIYNMTKGKYTYGVEYKKTDASVWSAKTVYTPTEGWGNIYVVFDNVVFSYYKGYEFDEQDIAYIKQAIGVYDE